MTSDKGIYETGHAEKVEQLRVMLDGYQRSQMLHVAARLGIADLLEDGPKSIEELAQATGAPTKSLYRVLRTLAGLGIFAEPVERTFEMTSLAEPLRQDYPGGVYGSAITIGRDTVWPTWGNLYQGVMTGENPFQITHGISNYEFFFQNPDQYEGFNRMMATRDLAVLPGVIGSYDFNGINKLVDVGGGYGHYCTAILKEYPDMHGIILDTPPAHEGANEKIESEGLKDRCTFVGGSFLDSIPASDCCFVKSVVMDHPDEVAIKLLTNCRQSVGLHGKVLLVERILRRTQDMFMYMIMMVGSGGQVRTEAENRELLEAAGLKLNRVIPTPSQYSILESVPA